MFESSQCDAPHCGFKGCRNDAVLSFVKEQISVCARCAAMIRDIEKHSSSDYHPLNSDMSSDPNSSQGLAPASMTFDGPAVGSAA